VCSLSVGHLSLLLCVAYWLLTNHDVDPCTSHQPDVYIYVLAYVFTVAYRALCSE